MGEIKKSATDRADKADTLKNTIYSNMEIELMSILGCKKVSRRYLADRLGISDRNIRAIISGLRKKGINICSDSAGGGYWLGNREETRRTIAEFRSRAYECWRTANLMDQRMQLDDQEEFDV